MLKSMHHIDWGSIFSGSFSLTLLGIGVTEVNMFALFVGGAVGITTIIYNITKNNNEKKRGKLLDLEIKKLLEKDENED